MRSLRVAGKLTLVSLSIDDYSMYPKLGFLQFCPPSNMDQVPPTLSFLTFLNPAFCRLFLKGSSLFLFLIWFASLCSKRQYYFVKKQHKRIQLLLCAQCGRQVWMWWSRGVLVPIPFTMSSPIYISIGVAWPKKCDPALSSLTCGIVCLCPLY